MDFGHYLLANSYPGALPIAFFSGFWLVFVALIVVLIVATWKLYEKAGKPGWTAIIPIYNMVILLEIVKRPIWWIILMFIPVVNIVVMFMVYYDLAKAFGKDIGYALGLFFLSIIFIPLLAFGDAQYVYAEAATEPETPPEPTPPAPPTNPIS